MTECTDMLISLATFSNGMAVMFNYNIKLYVYLRLGIYKDGRLLRRLYRRG